MDLTSPVPRSGGNRPRRRRGLCGPPAGRQRAPAGAAGDEVPVVHATDTRPEDAQPAAFPDGRVWAVEDCRHVSGRLERALLGAGERCYRVPPKLMAGARRAARTRGKSDPIDALAIARAALANPGLPVAEHTHLSHDLKLLVDHREDLVGTRTRIENRLRWHLHDLDPDIESAIPAKALHAPKFLEPLRRRLGRLPQTTQVRICRDLVNDIADLTTRTCGRRRCSSRSMRMAHAWSAPAASRSTTSSSR